MKMNHMLDGMLYIHTLCECRNLSSLLLQGLNLLIARCENEAPYTKQLCDPRVKAAAKQQIVKGGYHKNGVNTHWKNFESPNKKDGCFV